MNTDGNLDALERHLAEREEDDVRIDMEQMIEIFEVDQVNPDDVLRSFDLWDSLSVISLVAAVDRATRQADRPASLPGTDNSQAGLLATMSRSS